MREIEIELRGRIQGVGFRSSVRNFALRNGIRGYVQNKEEGDVFILAQSKEDRIRQLIDWLNSNPGFAKIDAISYRWKKAGKRFSGFSILRNKNFVVEQAKNLGNLGKYFVEGFRGKVPEHVAIIPDGNRRWAKERGMKESYGHTKAGSYENLRNLIKEELQVVIF